MKIGLNGNEANVSHRVGSGQYAYELISHLAKIVSQETKLTVYLQDQPMVDFPKASTNFNYEVLPPQKLWTMTRLQLALLSKKFFGKAPDLFFTPTHYTPLLMPVPSVISIMDMSFERFPEYFKAKDYYQLKLWTKISALQAKKIFTISEFSKSEICKVYNFPSDKVVVTYCGFDKERFNPNVRKQTAKIAKVKAKYNISNNFLLFLGTLQPRKNLVRLIEAFSQLSDKKIQLVVVGMINEGRGGWMNETIFQIVKKLGLESRVIFTGYVPDEEVPFLMVSSRGYVLPSLYEGFGIPPIEAMATGVPVAVSAVSSLPEICGEAALYFSDPKSPASIKNTLEKLISLSETESKKRIAVGLDWVKRYNWLDTAKKTLNVLENINGKN